MTYLRGLENWNINGMCAENKRLSKLGVWEGFEGRLVLDAIPTIPLKQPAKLKERCEAWK